MVLVLRLGVGQRGAGLGGEHHEVLRRVGKDIHRCRTRLCCVIEDSQVRLSGYQACQWSRKTRCCSPATTKPQRSAEAAIASPSISANSFRHHFPSLWPEAHIAGRRVRFKRTPTSALPVRKMSSWGRTAEGKPSDSNCRLRISSTSSGTHSASSNKPRTAQN